MDNRAKSPQKLQRKREDRPDQRCDAMDELYRCYYCCGTLGACMHRYIYTVQKTKYKVKRSEQDRIIAIT